VEDVREKEAQAIAAQNEGDFENAIQIWKQILGAYPNWEHGYAHYHLANCYVDAAQIDLAVEAYRKAIAIAPEDTMFSEALDSLLEARKMGHI
jgi:tetratricopeptide (TPR) repeat protein